MRIAIISDIHKPPPPSGFGRLNLKQTLGYISWQSKRRFRHDEGVLEKLKEDLQAHSCDHICFCGDQTNLGTEYEYSDMARWLHEIDAPRKISVIPGNHDAYDKDFQQLIKRYWLPWMLDKDSKHAGLPFIREAGEICIIGVSSAVLTAPFMADGRVSENQMRDLERLLAESSSDCQFRLLLIHHPPLIGVSNWRRSLRNIQKVQAYIEQFDIGAVCHGHLHVPMVNYLLFGQRRIPVLGTGSGSSNGHHIPPAQYFLLEIEKRQGEWQVEIQSRQYDPADKIFKEAALPQAPSGKGGAREPQAHEDE